MVIPSIDSGSSTSLAKNRGTAQASGLKNAAANRAPKLNQEVSETKNHLHIEEKPTSDQQPSGLQLLDDTAFEASSTDDPQDLADARKEANAQPDFTLELSGQNSELAAATQIDQTAKDSRADQQGQQRAKLPYTFNFGIRRPMAIAVAMSKPQLGNQNPASANEAIQQTLDLAATNRLPYERGSQISLVA
ncbi:hypothetical protein SAMN05660443_0272 [Marinospirillum celere]|uniref:Uncharacterized protein n=1 Tax=Marinospirillum celere TaxID=1122252 RepID=A0A1I1E372_9GAMM|nr:hypothetical protein [Marinospirillum celere]SFB81096.1 hypothetical protein SAMN05660443_0272 [Marinospirillum celere]